MSSFAGLDQQHYNGVRFCPSCSNIMFPIGYTQQSPFMLTYSCKNKCSGQQVNYQHKRQLGELLLYSQEFRKAASIQDKDLIFDPTVPRIQAKCPKCQYPEAVYYLTADSQQRRLIKRLICARIQNYKSACGQTWQNK